MEEKAIFKASRNFIIEWDIITQEIIIIIVFIMVIKNFDIIIVIIIMVYYIVNEIVIKFNYLIRIIIFMVYCYYFRMNQVFKNFKKIMKTLNLRIASFKSFMIQNLYLNFINYYYDFPI